MSQSDLYQRFVREISGYYEKLIEKWEGRVSLEQFKICLYHELKRHCAITGSPGHTLQQSLLAEFEAEIPAISQSKPGHWFDFAWDVQEWGCGETGDYGFGISSDKDRAKCKVPETLSVAESALYVPDTPDGLGSQAINRALFAVMPRPKLYRPEVNHEHELWRRLEAYLRETFWNPQPQLDVPGVADAFKQLVNEVYSFCQVRTEPATFAAWLYLWQDIELGRPYSKEYCASIGYQLRLIHEGMGCVTNAHRLFDGAFYELMEAPEKLAAYKTLLPSLPLLEVSAERIADDNAFRVALWRYPNEAQSRIELTFEEDEQVVLYQPLDNRRHHCTLEQAARTLREHFSHFSEEQ